MVADSLEEHTGVASTLLESPTQQTTATAVPFSSAYLSSRHSHLSSVSCFPVTPTTAVLTTANSQVTKLPVRRSDTSLKY